MRFLILMAAAAAAGKEPKKQPEISAEARLELAQAQLELARKTQEAERYLAPAQAAVAAIEARLRQAYGIAAECQFDQRQRPVCPAAPKPTVVPEAKQQ